MKESEAYLVVVGTTNKTHLYDYEQAITEAKALLLKVHKSNNKTFMYTDKNDTNDLLKLSIEHNILIYEDLGSGTLFDFKQYNISKEPTVQEKVQAGIDLISFSGDKLLGWPH